MLFYTFSFHLKTDLDDYFTSVSNTDAWVVYYYRQRAGIGRVHRLFARVGASLDLFLEVGLLRRRERVCKSPYLGVRKGTFL